MRPASIQQPHPSLVRELKDWLGAFEPARLGLRLSPPGAAAVLVATRPAAAVQWTQQHQHARPGGRRPATAPSAMMGSAARAAFTAPRVLEPCARVVEIAEPAIKKGELECGARWLAHGHLGSSRSRDLLALSGLCQSGNLRSASVSGRARAVLSGRCHGADGCAASILGVELAGAGATTPVGGGAVASERPAGATGGADCPATPQRRSSRAAWKNSAACWAAIADSVIAFLLCGLVSW